MSNSTNLKPNQRMKIITTRRTSKLWWDRKDLLLTTGTLCDRKKGRSGRSIHQSFSNKQKIDHAITKSLNEDEGEDSDNDYNNDDNINEFINLFNVNSKPNLYKSDDLYIYDACIEVIKLSDGLNLNKLQMQCLLHEPRFYYHLKTSYYARTCVIKLQSPIHSSSTSQSALKDNAITFAQNIPNIASSLPLAMSTLCDTIKVFFMGSRMPIRDQVPDLLTEAIERYERTTASIIFINISGVLDVKGTSVTLEDINYHLLQRLRVDAAKSSMKFNENYLNGNDVVYMIPKGSKHANKSLIANLLPGLYRTPFQYSLDGLEDLSRPVKVPIKDHVRYLLNYDDKSTCLQTRLLTSKPFFADAAQTIGTIRSSEVYIVLTQAIKDNYSTNDNSRINTLLKNIKPIDGHVIGSVHKRSSLRTLVHALVFNQGLFSIFLKANSSCIHHPLAMVFPRIDFDLHNIQPENLRSIYEQAEIVTSHPVVTAKFFHHLISSIHAT
ncbi:unnamed protein product [Rotaria sp. Silwood1]|nr:unnamed protein product [Rotaria sp. Silwood1]